MRVLNDPLGADEPPRGSILSIGNFDGVHVGHQAVLRHVVSRARSEGVVAAAMTLEPHPVKVLRPKEAPKLLTTLAQRLELIGRTGIEVTMVLPFTHALSRMEAEDFITRVLVDRLAVREVFIGKNFRFGADRRGDVDLLVRSGRELGFVAAGAPIVERDGGVVSSSRVRTAVANGRVGQAWRMLDRPVLGDGPVVVGQKLGRKLGFPTLNTEIDNELIPGHGVYVSAVYIPSFGRTFASVSNVGERPTMYESSGTTVESHLLDFAADVYGERVRVFFLHRLRHEQAFQSAPQLMAQIRKDVEAARLWFVQCPLDELELNPPPR